MTLLLLKNVLCVLLIQMIFTTQPKQASAELSLLRNTSWKVLNKTSQSCIIFILAI